MKVGILLECVGGWIAPPLLDEPELLRAMNAAGVLKARIVKCDGLSFAEGARVRFMADDVEVFSGRVFTKRRSSPEVIELVAYDELRYLQNRDCCVFSGVRPGEMLKRIAASLGLAVGEVADIDWRMRVKVYDNRRYIDMLADVLNQVLLARGEHYVVLAENGRLCLRSCRDMQSGICLELGAFSGYEYKTTIDEEYANRVKLIYEDKRRAARREFVAEDKRAIADYGVLQYVHKSAAANEETFANAVEKLRQLNKRQDSLVVRGAPADIAIRGGSIVWVRLDLGDRIVDSQALVKSARHYFKSGVCLMDLDLDCSLF